MSISFKEAAIAVLKASDEPLSAAEIADLALARGLIVTDGKTPAASIGAQIYVDLKKNPKTPFVKVGRGLFTVRSGKTSEAVSPALLLQDQNRKVRSTLKDRLHDIDPYQFEHLVADLLKKIGFENVEVTKRSGDKGVDILADLTVGGVTDVKTVVQVKRYRKNVSGKVIRELRGTAEVDQRGLVITTSDFQKGAISEAAAANKMPVSLINGERLVDLMVQYGVGVKKQEATILSIDVDYFENHEVSQTVVRGGGKAKALWPLPGGTTQYVETLDQILDYVAVQPRDREELIDWIIDSYDNVSSRKSGYGYSNVPKNMGLLDFDGTAFSVSDEGQRYLQKRDSETLYEIIDNHILAFGEIYELISQSDSPVDDSEILEFANDSFDVEWTSFAQVAYRLLWLSNLGKVSKVEQGYTAD